MTQVATHSPSTLAVTSVAQATQSGRWRTEAMRSHATARLIYFTKGQGRITVAGLTNGYGPNNLIYIPAYKMYGFDAGPAVFGQIVDIPAAASGDWPVDHKHMRLRDVVAQNELLTLIEAIERELKTDCPSGTRAAHHYLGLLGIYVERQLQSSTQDSLDARSTTATARLVARYTDLIARHYQSDRGVADYATLLGVTPTHLTRCCKQTCDKSALELLNDRIHYEACALLRETKAPVQDIAQRLGFHSAAYFTRSFQAKAGRTPSNFRKSADTTARL